MPRKNTHVNRSPHPDGEKEGVIQDSTGVQFGVDTSDNKKLNPSLINPERVLRRNQNQNM